MNYCSRLYGDYKSFYQSILMDFNCFRKSSLDFTVLPSSDWNNVFVKVNAKITNWFSGNNIHSRECYCQNDWLISDWSYCAFMIPSLSEGLISHVLFQCHSNTHLNNLSTFQQPSEPLNPFFQLIKGSCKPPNQIMVINAKK